MDWAKAIEINRTALQRIVAGLIAMVGFAAGATVELLPRAVHRLVLDLLRPAESAVRRLIAIMAHDLDVKPSALRPMPAGLALSRKSSGRAIFQLHDPRKRFDWSGRRRGKPGSVPRITFLDFDPLIPLFQPTTLPSASEPEPDDTIPAKRLCQRLAAISSALDDLPKQARRFVRWTARRARMKEAKFREALRPGSPPGYRKRPRHEVDEVLRECHALFRDLPPPNTS